MILDWFNCGLNLFLTSGRHSDINLVELGEATVKEEDRAVLLDGGVKSTPPKTHNSSVMSQLIRFAE